MQDRVIKKKIRNESIKRVEHLKYLITHLANQNSIQEEFRRRLKSGSDCYLLLKIILPYRFLSKRINIQIYRTVSLPVVLYGHETWYLTLTVERRMRVFENRVQRKPFGHKRDEVTGNGKNYTILSLMI
jgi:hypothetical protein